MRFKEGIKTTNGAFHKPSIVRIGRSDAINSNVVDVTLEELVNAKLKIASGSKSETSEELHKIMMMHKAAHEDLAAVRAKMDECKAEGKEITPEQERDFEVLKRRKQQLSTKIDQTRDQGNVAARDAEISRRRLQQEILDGAHIICATLSGSGHDMFQSLNIEFETVIIDEAAQSIELSALIPLKYGCSRCILVGDPKQLPPTVLSRDAARFQYEQSLFVRMQLNHPKDVHLLDTQYRMHPEISAFPSQAFYEGRLLDGPDMAKLRTRPWHKNNILGPYRFFDVKGQHQSAPRGHSLINPAEVDVAMKLYARLTTDCKGFDFTGKVGIITPYKSQLRELRSRFSQRYGDSILSRVEFNTTDAFQGRESEVIIFSCVRASPGGGIGFLSDIRRMNVGITRAKSSLWVLGNSQSLMKGEFWANLLRDAQERKCYTTGDIAGMLSKPFSGLQTGISAASNHSPMDISSPEVDEDVEMIDAPITVGFTENKAIIESFNESGEQDTFANREIEPHPSGGSNGLNTNLCCSSCGSSAHAGIHCDNVDARRASGCFRCGNLGHRKESCTTERCIDCGQFGHNTARCQSHNQLSRKEKDRVGKQEVQHKASLQHTSESQRNRQSRGHDPKIPIVRQTRTTPPPEIRASNVQPPVAKRKRDISPPAVAPKAPRLHLASSTVDQVSLLKDFSVTLR